MDNSHLKMEVLHTDCSSDDKKTYSKKEDNTYLNIKGNIL